MYEYRIVNVAKVIDGDTFDFDLDLGFYAKLRVRVRLVGIDTYEMWGKNAHELGIPARDFASAWLDEAVDLRVKTRKLRPGTPVSDGSFGRWAGTVFDAESGVWLADALREAGFEEK